MAIEELQLGKKQTVMREGEICGLPGKQEEMSGPVGTGYKGLLAISIVLIVVGGIICISGLASAVPWLSNPHGGRGVIAGLMIALVMGVTQHPVR